MVAPPRAKTENEWLADEAEARLADCRKQKQIVNDDVREAYFFTRPRLSRRLSSDNQPDLQSREGDEDELVTGVGSEVSEDFATEVIAAFFPAKINWATSKAAGGVPEPVWEQIKDRALENDTEIFKEIRSSNFDAELATALVPEAGIGTLALWIDETAGHRPIGVQHVPLRELEINIGPDGNVDDRFVVRHVRAAKLESVVPPDVITGAFRDLIREDPKAWVRVSWGHWRVWSERTDIVWQRVLMLDETVVAHGRTRGEGSCPLIVFRFSPDSQHAFGNGPTIDSLPMLRVIDSLTEAQANRASTAMNPPFAFPDDGILNFEGGIEDGKGYPRRPGGRGDEITPLYFTGDLDFGLFTIADLERSVRRKHFADYPDQQGKTPPTATQWIDEMVKAQRRIGTPGLRFFFEGPAQIFARFRYLSLLRGSIQPLAIQDVNIATEPSNPATKAQEQQEVQIAVRFLELINTFFPQLAPAVVDPLKTAKAIKDKLGDKLVDLRSEDEVKKMVEQLIQAAPELAGDAGPDGGDAGPDGGDAAPDGAA